MNVIQTDTFIVLAILWIAAIAVIVYDRIKYRKHYASQGYMIVLRMNNEYARGNTSQQGHQPLPVCLLQHKQLSLHH